GLVGDDKPLAGLPPHPGQRPPEHVVGQARYRALDVVGKWAKNQMSARDPGASCLIRRSITRKPSNGVGGTSSPDTRRHPR
ncbi:MAG: hypothetical protein OXF88_12525, partial [Rhodobacteraceae bacterium]|nr:hypothetical protein [Paracoccaceae bacterium]